MNNFTNIRLWVNQNLAASDNIVLEGEKSHYLNNVMRCQKNDILRCFNADDGEYECRIEEISKNKTVIKSLKKCRDAADKPSDVWLLFSPLKKDKTDFVIEKAVELGVAKIVPVITSRTNASHIRTERYTAQAIESAEQCGRLSIPEISNPIDLKKCLNSWNTNRLLYFADERQCGEKAVDEFVKNKKCPSAVLIGPEGGFSDDEAGFINEFSFTRNIKLGPRILRAETAAIAALAVWQSVNGDW